MHVFVFIHVDIQVELVSLPPSLLMHTVVFPEVVPLIVSVDSFPLVSK